VAPLLRQLPGVVRVEIGVQAEKPTHRIVRLRDWHFVPRDLYAVDLRDSAGKPLSDDEVDWLHEEQCLEVEAVQLEQLAVLRCLIKHHGLRFIFCEGLTQKGLANYREKIGVLRSMEKEQISQNEGGHGWRAGLYDHIREGVQWLEKIHATRDKP